MNLKQLQKAHAEYGRLMKGRRYRDVTLRGAERAKRYRTRQALGLRVYRVAAHEQELLTTLIRTDWLEAGATEKDIPRALEKLIADFVDGVVVNRHA